MEPLRGNTEDAMESDDEVSTKQQRIAELARIHPEVSFTSLAYHIDLRWLHEAYQRTRKDAAVGIDGQTAEEYAKDLGGNLRSLLERAKSGTYRAPPVRRVHIPKGTFTTGGTLKPLLVGGPTLREQKIDGIWGYCWKKTEILVIREKKYGWGALGRVSSLPSVLRLRARGR